MIITFSPLKEDHFPLLLAWLEAPHVKAWWISDRVCTPEFIREKYIPYTKGYKYISLQGESLERPMYASIINVDYVPIGYIQFYDKYDFAFEQDFDTSDLPASCAAIDLYIGDSRYVGKGIGSKVLNQFLETHVFPGFDHVVVDPYSDNTAAIKAYEKAGFKAFKKIDKINKGEITWMIKKK